jgi:hypothetical protein
MAKRAVWVLATMILVGCQQQTPPPASVAEHADNVLSTFERNADASCPKTAVRVREAGIQAREAFQSNNAAAIEQITTAMVALNQLCKLEKENCGTGPASIGMTPKEAIHTSWCFPGKKNTTETAGHIREQWVYPGRGYLYFDNDRLTAIQNEAE